MNIRLKYFRQLRGFSQEDMALKLGIKKSRYGSWERGERMLSLEQACMVTEVLGCTLDELVGREAERAYADPRQASLNRSFERMNEEGRGTLVKVARSMERDAANLTVKDGPERLDAAEKVS